ncbi:transcriptional regulator, TetR family [Streptomyces sp. WMMB 714]|uniref:ScbR family autoregulator-binding transcription factor n=1 Tax=Streptomyces sp. WMMB 714 TaxID=1286822 RepID=UPI0005F80D43|nr:ScbR family autoregulator-binding transcription factor [Streptomyces sp. WMMB 714]SCK31586.1 transcriptional regulator, TetR family [Streptomyces sp. WMMB 714]
MVKQERAARTRQLLLQAAAEVFVREGYARASLSTISGRAGVSNGALHFHFETKNLLAEAVEQRAAVTLRRIAATADEAPGSALQRLVDATHRLMTALHQDVVVRAGFELCASTGRRGGGLDLRREWQDWVGKLLAEAERKGDLAEGVTAADAATAVVTSTVGFEMLGSRDRAWVAPETVARFWELLLPRLSHPGVLGELSARGTDAGGPPQV